MKIVRDIYGEKIPEYDSREELAAAIAAFLRGDYGSLTALEVTFFRSCERDPDNRKWEAEHAGCLPEGFTQFDVDGALFVHRPASEPLEKSREWLRDQIGPHPLTPLNVYLALRDANA